MQGKPRVYQVSVDLGFNINEEPKRYGEFLEKIDIKDIKVMEMPRIKGDYEEANHGFYAVGGTVLDDFLENLESTGLAKEIHKDLLTSSL